MASNKSAAKNGTVNNNINNNNNNNHSSKTNGSSHANDNGGNSSPSTKDPTKPQKQIKVKQPKNRDSDCCSINFIKYVLIIIDVIFFLSGAVIIGLSAWTLIYKYQYVSLLASANFQFCTYALLLAGIGSQMASIIGCCGVKRENFAIILIYITLLLLVFLIELTVGTLSYIYERNVPDEMNRTLSDIFAKNYGISERHTRAIDHMQQDFMCCGAFRFEEYRQSVWLKSRRKDLIRATENRLVPDSCCFSMSDSCGESDHPSNIPYTGCYYKFAEDVRQQLVILGSVALGICVTKIFGIVLACSLYVKLKSLMEISANQTAANLMAKDRVSFVYAIEDSDDEERLPDPPSSINRLSFLPDFSESNAGRPASMYDRRV